jgi:two-component system nitrogen regulation response regulator NtrX
VDRILIVEDDHDLRELLSELFRQEGVDERVVCASLADVREVAPRALACELALLDVNLGEGEPSGVDVCMWLRTHGYRGPIVFLTGHASSDPRVVAASRQPNTRIMVKPVSIDLLTALAHDGR